jgi:hypothetical protein
MPLSRIALVAIALAACGGDDLVLPEDGVPTSITAVSGNNQSGTVRSELSDPITIRVVDTQGRPVGGQQVTFTVVTGGGEVEPVTVTTNASGEASISWTLGGIAGLQQVRAQATGGAAPDNLSVMLTATAAASAATSIEAVSGDAQSATVGSAVNDSLVVRTLDAEGNPVGGVTVAWAASAGGAVSEASTVTGADGRTGVRWTLGPSAGAQSATATVAGLDGSPVAFGATATVGSAGKLVVVQQPSTSVASGVVFPQQPRVQVQDALGNNVPGAGRAITAELISGPAGSSLLGSPTVGTNTQGLAIFTNLAISGPAGTYRLNFTGADLSGVTSNTITLSVGAATKLAFSTQPSNTTSGAAITPAVRVTVQDALGNTVTTASIPVTVSLASNPSGASLGGTRTVNAVNGVATFSNLTVDRAGTGYSLGASASGLTGATSSTFDVAAGGASTLTAVNTVPATTPVGGTVSPAPSVRVTDAGGNPVTGVTVTFTPVGGGSVTDGTQLTNAEGIATVGSWTIGTTPGAQYSLRASASGANEVTFQTTAQAGKLAIVTQPSATAASGEPFAQQPVIQLQDGSGAPVAESGVSVTATISSGGGTLGGTTTVTTDAEGRATFTNLEIAGAPGVRRLLFASPERTTVTSNEITVTAGPVSQAGSSVSAAPSAVETGVATTITVSLQDASGNPVPGVEITLSSDGAGTFGSAVITSGTDGTASTTYTPSASGAHGITATADGATLTTTVTVTDPEVIGAGLPSPSNSSRSPSATQISRGSTARLDLYVADAERRPVPGAAVAFSSDKTAAFIPSAVITNAEGRASTEFAPDANGTHVIRASSGTLTLASAIVTVTGSSSNYD